MGAMREFSVPKRRDNGKRALIAGSFKNVDWGLQDLDLYDKSRTLSYSGPVIRRSKGRDSGWSSWTDNVGALLDHYCELLASLRT
jgi:hypothetical protein